MKTFSASCGIAEISTRTRSIPASRRTFSSVASPTTQKKPRPSISSTRCGERSTTTNGCPAAASSSQTMEPTRPYPATIACPERDSIFRDPSLSPEIDQ